MRLRARAVWLSFVLFASARLIAGTIGATSVTPTSTPAGVAQVVTVTSVITDPSVIPSSVNLQQLDSSGRVVAILGTLHDDGLNGDLVAGDGTFTLLTTIFQNIPGAVTLRVSAAFKGSLQRVYSVPMTISITGTATGVTITAPADGAYINTSPIAVTGSVGDPGAAVVINGIQASLTGNTFHASVPLREGPNTVTAVASNTNGTTSTGSILVTLDTMPPHVSIYTPTNNYVTTDARVTVTGLVNDIVVGTVNPGQATVKVNGTAASVSNRSFLVTGIPLALGPNAIQAVAIDRAGNSATTSVTITRVTLNQTTLKVYSGDGQTALIRKALAKPLVAQLLNASGQPIPNVPVVFRVTGQNGLLGTGSGVSDIAVNTNALGLASVPFKVGSRVGAGNNRIEASTAGVGTTAVFTASATAAPAGLIVIDSGNNQSGVIGSQLPLPFIAIVTDTGNNRLSNVSVTFNVKSGGGNFGGKPSLTTKSDSDGRVEAFLSLGSNQGINNNLVEANFTGNTGFPASFTATGLQPGPIDFTQISGVVLDNSNIPIPGVTMRLFQVNQGNNGNVPQQVVNPVQTDAQGQFVIPSAPVGVFKLMADGGTVQTASYPTLEYDIVTVTGQNNTVGMPIYLPRLNAGNRICVDANTGGTLTIPQAPGFSLTIGPGAATFPGGSKTGCVSVTPVNMDKVPMAPGFGQQPRFIVTIQPVGTTFNPPAAMSIPNVDGLPPRAVTEMYSYDHDLASFVSIGTGTVSTDGSVIASDPGVGVLKAGWHCGGNPNTSGTAGTCPECQKCQGDSCMAVQDLSPCTDDGNSCTRDLCKNGICNHPKSPPTGDGNISGIQSLRNPPTYGEVFQGTILHSPGTCSYAGDGFQEIVTVASDTCNTGFTGTTQTGTIFPNNIYRDSIGTPITVFPCSISTPQDLQWFDTFTGNWVTFTHHEIVVTSTTNSVITCYKGVCITQAR